MPLILAGWAYSNDIEKKRRCEDIVRWAISNGCRDLVDSIPDDSFYFVVEPTTYTVGPRGGPMYRHWDYDSKERPSSSALEMAIGTLLSQWQEIVGDILASITRPLAFTGSKARRLLIHAHIAASPPWGSWTHLSQIESERRTFTQFRASVNRAISPHAVDHVDFLTDEIAEHDSLEGSHTSRR